MPPLRMKLHLATLMKTLKNPLKFNKYGKCYSTKVNAKHNVNVRTKKGRDGFATTNFEISL